MYLSDVIFTSQFIKGGQLHTLKLTWQFIDYIKVELPLQMAKNEKFKLNFIKKLPFFCFLFDKNRSFRSLVMVKNVTSRPEICHNNSYVLYCFLKLLFLTFSALKIDISKSNLDFDLKFSLLFGKIHVLSFYLMINVK